MTSVEKYDLRTDSWSVVPGMTLPVARYEFATTVLLC